MKWSFLGVILLGLLAAICMAGIVFLLPTYLRGPKAQAKAATEEVDVLVATKKLPAMTMIDAGCLQIKKLAKTATPENHLSDPTQAISRVLVRDILEGQAFTHDCFMTEGSEAHLASVLPHGKVAMSVLLAEDSAGLLYPGCFVDVLTASKPSGPGDAVSSVLLQNIRVIAIGNQTIVSSADPNAAGVKAEPGKKRMVTLMVDSEQGRLLQAALKQGDIWLAMRNPLETTKVAARPEPRAAPSEWPVVILRDGKPDVRKFTMVPN